MPILDRVLPGVRAARVARPVVYRHRLPTRIWHWLNAAVILVMLMGQSRVFYTMALDGLLPKVFSALHPAFRTPYKSNILLFIFVGLIATLIAAPPQARSPETPCAYDRDKFGCLRNEALIRVLGGER